MNPPAMRVGVLGPGVIGSIIGGRLARAGHAVTLIGRGQRLAELRERGLSIVDQASGESYAAELTATDDLAAEAPFDWLFICVRADQASAALEQVAAEDESENVVTMINHGLGVAQWRERVGPRLCFGFPGLSGFTEEGVVRYRVAPARLQSTSLGELDGHETERVRALADALSEAGIPSVVSHDIDAWLRFHLAWIHVLALAAFNGADRETLARVVDAIREGLDVVEALGFEMTPGWLRWFRRVPRPALVLGMRAMLKTKSAREFFSNPGDGQRSENREMSLQMRALARQAGHAMPAHEVLARVHEL